ncbi:MAG: tRNA (N6-threonylcarbamoyladenosine(37)-N6)-methyltransferase TrmO [Fibrobacterales bacterium]
MEPLSITPIGTFACDHTYRQLAPRQGTLKGRGETGFITLNPGNNFEQGLDDLNTFDRIWLIYLFDRNTNWKPKVNTPRGEGKRGVFATRAPYRPNQIGMSCVKLIQVTGLTIEVSDFDLLDGTPIVDIKPYIAYADSFPEASMGWLEDHSHTLFEIEIAPRALTQIEWIHHEAHYDLQTLIETQLSEDPLNAKRKRISLLDPDFDLYELAARTWRIHFKINSDRQYLVINEIASGYTEKELYSDEDPYLDKKTHKAFIQAFPQLS